MYTQRLALLVLAFLLALLAGCEQPAERDYAVGRRHFQWEDAARRNWTDDGARPLAATLWYPAPQGSTETAWRGGPFLFGRAALGAAFADGQARPLILLSHGTGGSAAQLSWLAEALVGKGFLVAAVNHHGNTAAEEQKQPAGFLLPGERLRDLSALLDHLRDDPDIAPQIDPQRVGAAGFSLGGYTVLAASGIRFPFSNWLERCEVQADSAACTLPPEADFTLGDVDRLAETEPAFAAGIERSGQVWRDDRIRAVYAIAPALVTLLDAQDLSPDPPPIRVLLARDDTQVRYTPTKRALEILYPRAGITTFDEAAHYSFLAPCGLWGRLLVPICKEPSGEDRAALHERVGDDAAAFFAEQL